MPRPTRQQREVAAGTAEHIRLIGRLGRSAAWSRAIVASADAIVRSLRGGGKVLLAGNGGSAADAQHIAGELVGRLLRERVGLAAITLSADTSVLTAIGNDYGYDKVFARQVEAHGRAGDVLWALSTSGDSPNVLEAVREARRRDMVVIGFAGRDGGELAGLADIALVVPHRLSMRIQEAHGLAYHIVCDLVEAEMAFNHG